MRLSDEQVATILALRDSVDPDENYNGYCYDVSELVHDYLRREGQRVDLVEAGAVRDFSHVYVVHHDGTIIDATLDQFYPGGRGNTTGDWTNEAAWADGLPTENPWMGELAVIPLDHPFAQHYYSHRREHGHDHYPDGYWITGREPIWWRHLHVAPSDDPA